MENCVLLLLSICGDSLRLRWSYGVSARISVKLPAQTPTGIAMRLSKTSRYVILFASVPLVCVLLYLMFTPWEGDAPPPKFISLAFLGYTNDSIGQRVPLFSISNLTRSSIQCVNIGPQTQVTN